MAKFISLDTGVVSQVCVWCSMGVVRYVYIHVLCGAICVCMCHVGVWGNGVCVVYIYICVWGEKGDWCMGICVCGMVCCVYVYMCIVCTCCTQISFPFLFSVACLS